MAAKEDPIATSQPPPRSRTSAYNARLGLILFGIYFVVYATFIIVNAFVHDAMKRPSIGGLNVAVVYGLGLIIGAFVLALIYMMLCRAEPAAGQELSEIEIAQKLVEEEGGA